MKIGIIGAGTMGQGITRAFVNDDKMQVTLCDVSNDLANKGKVSIKSALDKAVQKGKIAEDKATRMLENIKTGTIADACECDFVIEAAVENMEIKKSIFQLLDKECKPETILATNTSSLSITEISKAINRPVIGTHFFNPAWVMKLVEIVRAVDTPDEVVATAKKLFESIGKVPVEVDEQPGFVVNRILIPMINEANGLYALRAASVEDIDTSMMLGANHPIGPLAIGDLVGLDVCLAIMEVIQKETGDPKYRPEPLLRKMVRAGKLGRKSGEGFYKY